jgi:transposase
MQTRHDLTDEQWAKLEPLLPDRKPIRGGRWMDHRKVVDGVLWRTRSGSAWRDLPPEYGNWKTVYNRHRRWSGDGTWREVLSGLRVDCDILDGGEWVLGVDGTVIRAHHHAAGARHEPPKDIPAEVLAPTVLEVAVTPVKSTGGSIE